MTNESKIKWLSEELTNYISYDRSDTPCDFYDFCTRKECKYQYTDLCAGEKCSECLIEHIDKIAKPTLAEDERVILRNIDKAFYKIGRAKTNKGLYLVYTCQDEHQWFTAFNDNLFQFIKERRRILN